MEGVATMLCRLTTKVLTDKEPQYSSAIDSFIATSLVVAGKFEMTHLFLFYFLSIICVYTKRENNDLTPS